MRWLTGIALACVACAPPADPRPFRLGFTPFPYDVSAEAQDWVYDRFPGDADLVAHHMDNGIPWVDALNDQYPYAPHIMADWQMRKDRTPAGHGVYVAVTPIRITRDGLSLHRGAGDDEPLPPPFDAHAAAQDFTHPDVVTAYVNYCERVIAFFQPDHLAIGIEVNLLRKSVGVGPWNAYVALNESVYQTLKASHPDLPIFVSFSAAPLLEGYEGAPDEFAGAPDPAAAYLASQRTALEQVMTASDYLGLSFYPFATAYYATDFPEGMEDSLFSLSPKPVAIAETGVNAQTTSVPGLLVFPGTEERQAGYLSRLLDASGRHGAKLVVNFVLRDYDPLCASLPDVCQGYGVLWRDTGLYSETAEERLALQAWRSVLARPYAP